jgi:hypothetical protein
VSEHNDSWLKIEASRYYAVSGNRVIFPRGGSSPSGPFPQGSSGDGYFKLYKSGNINFNFSTRTSDFQGYKVRADFNSVGNYTIRIKARSNSHVIDRLVLYKVNSVSLSSAQNLNRVTTKCSGTNSGGGTGNGGDSGTGGDSGSGNDSGSGGNSNTGGNSGSGSGSGPSGGGTQVEITSIQLLNADNDNVIASLTNGVTVNVPNLNTQKLGIIANTSSSGRTDVSFNLSGPLSASNSESVPPYSLFGDIGTNITGKVLPAGNYTLTVSTNGDSKTISFTLVNGSGDGGSSNDDDADTGENSGTGGDNDPGSGDDSNSGSGLVTSVILVDASDDSTIGSVENGNQFTISNRSKFLRLQIHCPG